MFSPTFPFTKDVLEATVKAGSKYFVRNSYNRLFDHFHENVKGYFLITHYSEFAKAQAHLNIQKSDSKAFLYDWTNEEHRNKLYIAASQPEGYKIYSSYFLPDFKKLITKPLKDKINRYMYRHTNWKPGRGENVKLDFYLHYGDLYTNMKYGGQEIIIKFEEIEKT